MPSAVNITLKDAAGTDCLFTLLSPSAGDNAWANWRYKTGDFMSMFPAIASRTYVNAARTARKVQIKLQVPYTVVLPAQTLPEKVATWDFDLTVTVPNSFSETLKPDCVAYAKNLLANALIQSMLLDAAPAT